MKNENDQWYSLDNVARSNLSESALMEFFHYRDCLRQDGHKWQGDAEIILKGYIWDASEESEED